MQAEICVISRKTLSDLRCDCPISYTLSQMLWVGMPWFQFLAHHGDFHVSLVSQFRIEFRSSRSAMLWNAVALSMVYWWRDCSQHDYGLRRPGLIPNEVR